MKEQNLIDAGFEKVIEKDEGYYYYTLHIGREINDTLNFCLISCGNDEFDNDEWYVEIFDYQSFRFTSIEDLRELITVLNSNIKQ